ncbi:MAG: hypothetical protein HKN47_24635 [Pirellulaceae bacterium]|nr:hypothetical protein [Pirellulaceae bacterium]
MSGKVSIRWSSDAALSAVHAAHVVATGGFCTDQKTEQALVESVTDINNRLLSASLDIGTFWLRLLSETAFDPTNTRTCEIALLDSGCSKLQLEQTASVISNRLSDSRLAFQRRFPKLTEQLALRGRPIRDLWDTVGPGLLSNIAKQIWVGSPPNDWWPPRVDAVLVQPMRGGDGGFDSAAHKFWIEAVLTDSDPDVPEVLRVAWLVTQLAVETQTLERSSERTSERSGTLPWSIGSVPLVLSAGKYLDLVKGPELPIQAALQHWRLGDANTAAVVTRWWQAWQKDPTPMPVGLKHLDKLLGPARDSSPGRVDAGIDLTEFDD